MPADRSRQWNVRISWRGKRLEQGAKALHGAVDADFESAGAEAQSGGVFRCGFRSKVGRAQTVAVGGIERFQGLLHECDRLAEKQILKAGGRAGSEFFCRVAGTS